MQSFAAVTSRLRLRVLNSTPLCDSCNRAFGEPVVSDAVHSLSRILILMLSSLWASGAGSALASDKPTDLDGKPVEVFETSGTNGVVLLFTSVDCPIANRYAPEVRRIWERFHERKVSFWLVYADRDTTTEAIRKHLKEYQYPLAALRDPQHALVKQARATRTPECAVFDPSGKLVYHGRIDDRYVAFGKMRPKPTTHDLEDAIEAVLQRRAPKASFVPAIGCNIPDLP